MTTNVARFQPTGLLAIDPRAFGVVVSQVKAPAREVERIGPLAVISIVGPLEHHKGEGFCDSYEDLSRRFAEAFNSDAKAVVLKVDSPGGLVAGCFATALELRAKRESTGKPLYAVVIGNACSAGYALASQADRIVIAPGAIVGSVGIIDARVDMTKADAMMGLQYAFVTSGERKAFGNPHLPLSDDELAVRQATVDANAAVFFDLVAARRPTTVSKLKALQAGQFSGSAAIEHGLADKVGTFEDLLAELASDSQPPARASTEEEDPMSAARKALEEAAKGDGEEAAKAKRALAAWDEKDDEKKKDDDAKAAAAEEEAKAAKAKEEEEAKAKAEEQKKDEEAKAAAASAQTAAGASAMKAVVDEQRRAFLDTRPDLTPEQRASVEGLPMERVRAIVNAIPKPNAPKPNHAATVTPAATRAEGQDSSGEAARLAPAEKSALDTQMGLSAITYTGVKNTEHMLTLGEAVPVTKKVG